MENYEVGSGCSNIKSVQT